MLMIAETHRPPAMSPPMLRKAVPASRIVQDGDAIGRFEAIHTPGPSPGGIALYQRATGILFCGDIIYDGPLNRGRLQFRHF